MRLVLASGSPRRRELLTALGLTFDVLVSDIEEKRAEGERVEAYVERLAREKGRAIAEREQDAWVISADTVVYLDDHLLEKPRDFAEAKSMLRQLSGRTHVVYSGVALQNSAASYFDSCVVTTKVTFVTLSDEQIDWYVTTGEPMDKAGGYAVQGIGAMFIASIDGNYTNVVGLPLAPLAAMFERAGLRLFA